MNGVGTGPIPEEGHPAGEVHEGVLDVAEVAGDARASEADVGLDLPGDRDEAVDPGVETLPDGTFVVTTYGHWAQGEPAYILSVRFKLEELDALAKKD